MVITYIIGNGFDLNIGLPTDYSHFYQYYCQQPSESEAINRLKENIKQYNNSNWADLEVGLGAYTNKVISEDEFVEVYLDLNTQIIRYMSAVNELADSIISNELKDKIVTDLLYPESSLPLEYERLINGIKQSDRLTSDIQTLKINILSFNYTLTLEKLKLPIEFKSRRTDSLRCIFGGITHIHRTIKDRGVWLGVDNEGQIDNESFRTNMLIRQLLVKPFDIISSGNALFNQADHVIGDSDLICVFGSSMGITDNSWWRLIGKYINNGRRLIYFAIDNSGFKIDHLSLYLQNKIRSEIAVKLRGSVSHIGKEIDSPDTIIVPMNSTLFRDKDYSKNIEENFVKVMSSFNPKRS